MLQRGLNAKRCDFWTKRLKISGKREEKMGFLEILKAILLGIVEGVTEWLPISSTGHMILVDDVVKLNMSEPFIEMFLYVVQLGAILAVVYIYWHKLVPFAFKNKKIMIRKNTLILWSKIAGGLYSRYCRLSAVGQHF